VRRIRASDFSGHRLTRRLHSFWTLASGTLAGGAFSAILLVGAGMAISYAVQSYLARCLGAQQFGTYSFATAILNVLALLVSFDLGNAALRYAGPYAASKQWGMLRGFVRFSRLLVLFTSLTVAMVLGVFGLFGLPANLDHLRTLLLAGGVLLIPSSMILLELNLLQALQRVYEVRVPNLLVRPVVLFLCFYAVSWVDDSKLGATEALLSNAAGTWVALALSLYFWRKNRPATVISALRITARCEWIRFSSVTLATNLLYAILSNQADIILVGTLIGPAEAGIYSAASQLSFLVAFGSSTINHVAATRCASYHELGDLMGLRSLVCKLTVLNVVVAAPVVLVLGLWGEVVLRTFGPEFTTAYPVLVTLIVGGAANAFWGGLWGTLLTMTGYHKVGGWLVTVVAALNVGLALLLIPQFGMLGAAWATSVAVLVRAVAVAIMVRRRLGFWPWTDFFSDSEVRKIHSDVR